MRDITLQIGDRVCFLDQKGEGIVTKIMSKNTVGVTIEDDFELPYSINNLVKIEQPKSMAEQLFYKSNEGFATDKNSGFASKDDKLADKTKNKGKGKNKDEDRDNDDQDTEEISLPNFPISLPKIKGRTVQKEGIYLSLSAVTGSNQGSSATLSCSSFSLQIINNCPNRVCLQPVFESPESLYGSNILQIPEFSIQQISLIELSTLDFWRKGYLQGFFVQKDGPLGVQPFRKSFVIPDPIASTPQSEWVSVFKLEEIENIGKLDTFDKLDKYTDHTKNNHIKTMPQPFKNEENKPCIVDLHIESLLENTATFVDPQEYLQLQLSTFERHLNIAITNGSPKIIFIHGIGKGILQKEMEKILKDYRGLHYSPAPSSLYGHGAMEIFLSKR